MPIAAAVALVPQVIALIQQGIVGATLLWTWVVNLRKTAKQSEEWTVEAENAFVEGLISRTNDPAYQPDPDTVPLGKQREARPAPEIPGIPANGIVIIEITKLGPDRELWCDPAGNCFMQKPSQLVQRDPRLFYSPATGLLFYLTV